MDIRMPGIDGVEATRRIRREHPPEKTRVIVLTTFDHDDIVLAALRAGANGFLRVRVTAHREDARGAGHDKGQRS
jgi:DNA-binding NarL/FixJ family response regulator